MPADVQLKLEELHDRTKNQLERIDDAVAKMLSWLDVSPETQLIDLAVLVDEVLDNTRPDAEGAGVDVRNDVARPTITEVPAGLIEHALEELVENAIQVERPSGREGAVVVAGGFDADQLRIAVSDDGPGIPENVASRLFQEPVSRAGRIGVGLLWNRQLLRVAGGDLALSKSGPNGSTFEITIGGRGSNASSDDAAR